MEQIFDSPKLLLGGSLWNGHFDRNSDHLVHILLVLDPDIHSRLQILKFESLLALHNLLVRGDHKGLLNLRLGNDDALCHCIHTLNFSAELFHLDRRGGCCWGRSSRCCFWRSCCNSYRKQKLPK